MKLIDILSEWKVDSKIDISELAIESIKTAELHSKYLNIFINEKLFLRKRETDYKSLFKLKFEYYLGTITDEALKINGWEPNPLKIIRQDIPMYIDADKDVIQAKLLLYQQEEKVDALENIIKSINNRSFYLNNALADIKFKHGEN